MPYWMNYANLEDLQQDKQNTKNTGGIMKYQLMIFQLILAVFFRWLCIGTKDLHHFGKNKIQIKIYKSSN